MSTTPDYLCRLHRRWKSGACERKFVGPKLTSLSLEIEATFERSRHPTVNAPAATSESHNRTKAESHNRTHAKMRNRADIPVRHKRVNRGYKLREDLIKACKRIALEEDRKLYEVMEEALAQYLAQKEQRG